MILGINHFRLHFFFFFFFLEWEAIFIHIVQEKKTNPQLLDIAILWPYNKVQPELNLSSQTF